MKADAYSGSISRLRERSKRQVQKERQPGDTQSDGRAASLGSGVRFASNRNIQLLVAHSDRRRIARTHGLSFQFASDDADASRGINADRHAVSRNSVDRQHDVVADQQLFAFFAAQNQHVSTSLKRFTVKLSLRDTNGVPKCVIRHIRARFPAKWPKIHQKMPACAERKLINYRLRHTRKSLFGTFESHFATNSSSRRRGTS